MKQISIKPINGMRQMGVLLFLLFISCTVYAQDKNAERLIIDIPFISITSNKAIQIGTKADFFLTDKLGIAVGGSFRNYEAPNRPKDYKPGGLGGWLTNDESNNGMGEFFVRGLFSRPINPGSRTSFNVELGPSLIVGNKSTFTPKNSEMFGSNYEVGKNNHATIGASASAGIRFQSKRAIGLGIHINGNANALNSFAGGGLSFFVDLKKVKSPN